METNVFTKDGIEIRRLESGRCVREDEWEQFVELNEVRYSAHSGCDVSDIGAALRSVVHVTERAIREAPSIIQTHSETRSPPSQTELWVRDPKEFIQFRRVALENNLSDPEELNTTDSWFTLRTLVMPYLNERCGLSPEESIVCGHVHPRQAVPVLELQTNTGVGFPGRRRVMSHGSSRSSSSSPTTPS